MGDAGRVIAGTAGGRRLRAPGPGTRPLSDRVKQALFAILEPDLPGARFLDLFAGSGAGGIEALSRGAAAAVFVEQDPAALRTLAANLEATGLAGGILRQADAAAYLSGAAPADGPFDIILADPPYARSDLLLAILEALGRDADGRLLASGGRVVAKHFWRDAPPGRIGLLASERERRFGDTALTFYRRADPAQEAR